MPKKTFLTRTLQSQSNWRDQTFIISFVAAPYRRPMALLNRSASPDSISSGTLRWIQSSFEAVRYHDVRSHLLVSSPKRFLNKKHPIHVKKHRNNDLLIPRNSFTTQRGTLEPKQHHICFAILSLRMIGIGSAVFVGRRRRDTRLQWKHVARSYLPRVERCTNGVTGLSNRKSWWLREARQED